MKNKLNFLAMIVSVLSCFSLCTACNTFGDNEENFDRLTTASTNVNPEESLYGDKSGETEWMFVDGNGESRTIEKKEDGVIKNKSSKSENKVNGLNSFEPSRVDFSFDNIFKNVFKKDSNRKTDLGNDVEKKYDHKYDVATYKPGNNVGFSCNCFSSDDVYAVDCKFDDSGAKRFSKSFFKTNNNGSGVFSSTVSSNVEKGDSLVSKSSDDFKRSIGKMSDLFAKLNKDFGNAFENLEKDMLSFNIDDFNMGFSSFNDFKKGFLNDLGFGSSISNISKDLLGDFEDLFDFRNFGKNLAIEGFAKKGLVNSNDFVKNLPFFRDFEKDKPKLVVYNCATKEVYYSVILSESDIRDFKARAKSNVEDAVISLMEHKFGNRINVNDLAKRGCGVFVGEKKK